ncbi:MAG: PBP1A family penicillin-binding protein [Thermodesulfobacteriota bacterium]|nr:PBP1A family penicillin-binding protein [Thermodesulfobacteriota bacterium]
MKIKHGLLIQICSITAGLILVFVTVIALDAYRQIRKAGDMPAWKTPSRVYSNAFRLEPGDNIVKAGLLERMEGLRYCKVTEVMSEGEYSVDRQGMTLYLHDFDYPKGHCDSKMVRISLRGTEVTGIMDPTLHKGLDHILLEPQCLGGVFGDKNQDRTIIDIEKCPAFLIDAIIATEDRRFFEHKGIDLRSIARAFLVNMQKGKIVEGGSTITQQLIKNLFLSNSRSLIRKTREAFMSLIMEALFSKKEILGMYINEIYMGQIGHMGMYGLGRASILFFDKNIAKIDLAEAAMLAGIIRAPNYYSPYRHPGRAMARRNTVLALMLSEGKIDQNAYTAAKDSGPGVVRMRKQRRLAPYFLDYVISSIRQQYPLLSRGGYRIFTTLDMHMQAVSEKMLKTCIANRSRSSHMELESACVLMDTSTGAIRAMVGGKDYAVSQFNRASDLSRPVGSIIKPAIYYTAMRRGYTLASILDDSPVKIGSQKSSVWTPENFDHTSHGRVLLTDALVHSYNQATVRLGMDVGINNIMAEVRHLLPMARVEANPSLFLGTLESSPLDMASMYSAFANMGSRATPFCVRAILDENNTPIYQATPCRPEPVLDPSVTYLVNHCLKAVLESGTARASHRYGMPEMICGKTGTSDNLRDSWFAAFGSKCVCVTWMGRDDFGPAGLTGASGAMPLCAMIMGELGIQGVSTEVPGDIVFLDVDEKNGELASKWTMKKRRIPFIKGTGPTEVSKRDEPPVIRFFRSIF